MIIIGIICIVAAGGVLYNYFSNKKRLEEITAVETSTAGSLQAICQGVADEIGAGSFQQQTEVKGVVECDQPLESELAKQPCVHYRMSVEREWEEDYEEVYTVTDPETGREEQRTRQATRRGSETVSSNSRSIPFVVRDETGTIAVDPEDAKLDTEQVVDRFEPQSAASGGTISFGGMSFSVGSSDRGARRRTLGYRFKEWILPLNRPVYILGQASDKSGQLRIQKPTDKGKFIISLKSEEELLKSAKTGMTWSLIASIILFLAGVVLVILHFAGV
jgi:hypothetical protein